MKTRALIAALAIGLFASARAGLTGADLVLQIAGSATNISLGWDAPNAQLESAVDPGGPWALVPATNSPYNLTPELSAEFFRLVMISGTNGPPTVTDHIYYLRHDQPLNVLPPGVLANDFDINGLALTAALYSPPIYGTVDLEPDGSFYYTPAASFTGTDSFTYVANNTYLPGGPATVSIVVTNGAPVAVNDVYGVQFGLTLNVPAPGVLGNDSDPDGDVLYAVAVSPPANGVLSLQSDGSFSYQPNGGFAGTDSFTYVATDGIANSAMAQVTLLVHAANLPPVAANDCYSVTHDQNLNVPAPGVLANDSDPDADPLTASLLVGTTNGTVILFGNGSFTYRPASGFTGTDQFTYQAGDGLTYSAPALVTIYVTNGVPEANPDVYFVQPGTIFSNCPAGVLANDTDPDNDPLVAQLVTGTTYGTVNLNADGSFTYQPLPDFTGTDVFTYTASDGITNSPATTVTLLVTNLAPVANPDVYGVCPGEPLTVAAPGVLANDTDAYGETLCAVLITGPANGTLTLGTNGSVVYLPFAGYYGPDSFTYAATDGTTTSDPAVVSIYVNTNCLAPLAVPDIYQVLPNTPLTVAPAEGVLGNDIDVQQCPLTAVQLSGVANGVLSFNPDGSFTYTPAAGFAGTDSFTYAAMNGPLSSGPTLVTLTVGDAAPVAAPDAYSVHANTLLTVLEPGVLDNDEPARDGATLTSVLVTPTTCGSLAFDPSGSFTYQPNTNFTGVDSFTYAATDGALTSAVTLVTIAVCNQAPVAGDDDYAVGLNSSLSVPAPGVLANDVDDDGDPITAVLLTPPANASAFQLMPDGSFQYTPLPGYTGPDSFTYEASDGICLSAPATVTLTVTATPIANNDYYVYNPGMTLIVSATNGVLANDFAPGNGPLQAVQVGAPVPGFTLNADGGFQFDPTATPQNAAPVVASYVATFNGIGSLLPGIITLAVLPPYFYLDRVSFGGGTVVHPDTNTITFEPPQWVDTNHNGVIDPKAKGEHSWPYSIVRNGTLKASASFSYLDASPFKGKQVMVRGTLKNNGAAIQFTPPGGVATTVMIPPTVATQDEKRSRFTIPLTAANGPLPNVVDMIDPLQIVWEFSIDKGANWFFCGTSQNRLYVTYATPITSPLYETLLYYGSYTGAGLDDGDKLGLKIWQNFAKDPKKPTAMAARMDGTLLTYYNNWNVFQESGAAFNKKGVSGLLNRTDGRCGTWALFMLRAFEAQGLKTATQLGINAGGAGILVKSWNFPGPAGVLVGTPPAILKMAHAADAAFPFENAPNFNKVDTFWPLIAKVSNKGVWSYGWLVNPAQVDYGQGSAQNNTNPRGLFQDHAIIMIGKQYFDPSYGGGPFASLLDLQNAELDGYCYMQGVADLLKNNNLSLLYQIVRLQQVDPKKLGLK
jgi:hypothetical protein